MELWELSGCPPSRHMSKIQTVCCFKNSIQSLSLLHFLYLGWERLLALESVGVKLEAREAIRLFWIPRSFPRACWYFYEFLTVDVERATSWGKMIRDSPRLLESATLHHSKIAPVILTIFQLPTKNPKRWKHKHLLPICLFGFGFSLRHHHQ